MEPAPQRPEHLIQGSQIEEDMHSWSFVHLTLLITDESYYPALAKEAVFVNMDEPRKQQAGSLGMAAFYAAD
jgi:hypothetical protein